MESWSKANGANVVVGEIPAGTVASSEPSHQEGRFEEAAACKTSRRFTRCMRLWDRCSANGLIKPDSVEVDAGGFVDYGKFVDRLNDIESVLMR